MAERRRSRCCLVVEHFDALGEAAAVDPRAFDVAAAAPGDRDEREQERVVPVPPEEILVPTFYPSATTAAAAAMLDVDIDDMRRRR